MIYVDKKLSKRLERTEALANAAFVNTRARETPASDAQWIAAGSAYAMFDGACSPLTQTFGLGLDDGFESDLDRIESFYAQHHAPIFHEVSPLADASLMPLLLRRRYQPIELTSVMYLPLSSSNARTPSHAHLSTRVAAAHETELWAKTSASGWRTESEELSDFMLDFGKISAQCQHGYPYLALQGNTAVATGMMFIFDDVALLAGASTIPSARRQGAQSALLAARLQRATEQGCTIAMMCAAPGSQSQLNAEKHGFRIAYTRIKWMQK